MVSDEIFSGDKYPWQPSETIKKDSHMGVVMTIIHISLLISIYNRVKKVFAQSMSELSPSPILKITENGD